LEKNMSPNNSPHLAFLDGWRGLAIVVVLVAHFQSNTLAWMGNLGVQLFFVLSGYLMGGLLFIKEVPLKDFFARRFTRVFPTFFVFIAAMAIYAMTLQPKLYAVPISEFLSTLAFARTYFPAEISISSGDWPIGHMWSLNVEEHSYILLGAGALLVRSLRQHGAALVFLWLSVLVVLFFTVYYPMHHPDGASAWHRRSEAAALGLLAAAAYRTTAASPSFGWTRNTPPALPLLSFVVAILCFWLNSRGGRFSGPILQYTLAPLLLAYSMNHLAQAPDVIRQALSSRVLCWFGTCSFSLYLWQQPFYYVHARFGMPIAPALIGALACGALSFYCLENPLRQYLNNQWRLRQQKKLVVCSDPVREPVPEDLLNAR
jgi:peptidoglycan/LPS O-acetylase OafA/YrhL